MLERHLTRDSAEQYLLGALSPEQSSALESHTLDCEPCARLLQEEALLEEQLREVASQFPQEDRVIRPARWHLRRVAAGAVGAALAAAASLALVLGLGGGPRGATHPGPIALEVEIPELAMEMDIPHTVVACPDLATQADCTEKATERGLLVQYPWAMGEVPRYEARTGLPDSALSMRHPVSL